MQELPNLAVILAVVATALAARLLVRPSRRRRGGQRRPRASGAAPVPRGHRIREARGRRPEGDAIRVASRGTAPPRSPSCRPGHGRSLRPAGEDRDAHTGVTLSTRGATASTGRPATGGVRAATSACAQASAVALIPASVVRMPSRSSTWKDCTPPSRRLVSRLEMVEMPSGASRRCTTRVPVAVGSSVKDQIGEVVLDPERDLLVRLEAHDLGLGRPHQQAAPVDVDRPGAELDRPTVARRTAPPAGSTPPSGAGRRPATRRVAGSAADLHGLLDQRLNVLR